MSDDFITRYVKLLKGITDAPEEFQEATALFLVSTAVGRRFVFYSVPETPLFLDDKVKGGKLLNLWFIFIGKTRITRKSFGVLNRAEEMVEYLSIPKIPQAFSASYLVTSLHDLKDGGEVHATLIVDECSGMFELLKAKIDHVLEEDAILSTIYDGKTYNKGTQTRGREYVPRPYLTVLLASTDYLPKAFTDGMFQQGLLNRYIIIPAKRENRMTLRTKGLTNDEKTDVEYLKKFLKALKSRGETLYINLNSEAKQLYNDFEIEIENQIEKENLGLKEGYLGNLPNLVIRIASLYRISRMEPEEIEGYRRPFLIVEKEDLTRAIAYTRKVWKWFEKLMEMRATETKAEEVYTLEKYEAVVRKVFAEAGTDELSQNIIRKQSRIPTPKLEEVLKGIAKWRVGPTTKGRKAKLWKLL